MSVRTLRLCFLVALCFTVCGIVTFSAVAAPGNDAVSNAQPLSGNCPSVTVTGSNRGASRESWETKSYAGSSPSHSIWYKWSAPVNGPVAVDTSGSDFDTVLAVYNKWPISSQPAWQNDDGIGSTSLVPFNAVQGTTYYIVVDGYNGQMGNIRLTVTFACKSASGAAPAGNKPSSVSNAAPAGDNPSSATDQGKKKNPGVSSQMASRTSSNTNDCNVQINAKENKNLTDRSIPAVLSVCVSGFGPGPVYMQLIRPDGAVRPPQPQPISGALWTFAVPLIDPPGRYTIRATQGNTVGTATFTLVDKGTNIAIAPSVGSSGSTFTVYVTGFPPNTSIDLDLYSTGRACGDERVCDDYLRTYSVRTNARGQSTSVVRLSDPDGVYRLEAVHPARATVSTRLILRPMGGTAPQGRFLQNILSQKCIDVKGASAVDNEAPLQLWDCEWSSPSTDQRWELTPAGFIRNTLSGRCIDVWGRPGVERESRLQLWDCEYFDPDNTDQRWELTNNGFIRNLRSGLCIDVWGRPGRDNEAPLQLWDCEFSEQSTTDQRWSLR
jgi:hypothetical protein